MKKKYITAILLLISAYAYSYRINVIDDYDLIDKEYIEFWNRDELIKQIEVLTIELLNRGYVTSKIIDKEENLVIIPGKIQKVILQDNSTKNAKLKKELLNLNKLEGEILNIRDIDEIVSKFKKIKGNNVKIRVENIKGSQDSNIIIINDFKPAIYPKISADYSKGINSDSYRGFKYVVGFGFEQLIGMNDELNVNFSLLSDYRNMSLKYKIPIRNNEATIQYQYTKDILNEDVETIEREILLNVNTDINNIDLNNSITINNKRFNVRKNTNITNNWFYEFETSLVYTKLLNLSGYYVQLMLKPKIGINIADIRAYKKKDYVITSGIDFNLYSKYYDLITNVIYNKNMSSDSVYDRYTRKLNIYGIDNIPLSIAKTDKLIVMNNKMKYPMTINKINVIPYIDVALGSNFKEYSTGMSIGSKFKYKQTSINLEYSRSNKGNSVLNLNLGFEF
ncbi:hypothetical protein [Histophilus somni]|uniref:hypothetical protein n=1 Tax=Histophilus somni TaxID=731 RepID=UPI000039778D|nr:hypothetical protein [Histophilus somni]ACA30805.1 Hemolysin activation/secretion protein-like protein [Histophilus somni 2336]QQF86764.1 hypothetical protein JFL55_03700 [Histophilus somni]QQJ89439.1 hypothetical protein JFJ84_06650 [Histophilus somni]